MSSIGSAIGNVASAVVSGILDGLKTLFVPQEGFLDSAVIMLQQSFAELLGCENYDDLVQTFKDIGERPISDLKGYIDISLWDSYMPTVKGFIRAVFYPMFIFGIIRYLQWVIRGSSSLNGTDGGSAHVPESGYYNATR